MKRKAVNPTTLYESTQYGFSHAVEQNAGRTLHLAGQVAWNGAGELVGAGDLLPRPARRSPTSRRSWLRRAPLRAISCACAPMS